MNATPRLTPLWRAGIAALVIGCVALAAALASATDTSGAASVALAFDPGSNSLIKVQGDTVYRRALEGGDWQPLRLPNAAQHGRITTVAVSPHSALYVAGLGLGVLRSADGGRTWSEKRDGLPDDNISAIAVHADQPATVYAYVSGKGMFRSEDAGDHWRLMDLGPRGALRQFIHSNMPGSMQTGWLFAATDKGVARSMDCFCGWRDAGAFDRAVSSVAYDPNEPKRVYAASGDGVFVSSDGGEHWAHLSAPPRITALVALPSGDLVAADDAGALLRSSDRGVTWRALEG
ncbi:MAG TPA: hypothetical protein VJ722_00480 [Rhodanobacteraceae bacterium]|nr:hypothetical protein [Rhodanobacteraceae bacterium]